MQPQSLSTAVYALAQKYHSFTDADLNQEWAWRSHTEGVRFARIGTNHKLRDLAVVLATRRSQSNHQRWLSANALLEAGADVNAQQAGGYTTLQTTVLNGILEARINMATVKFTRHLNRFFPALTDNVEVAGENIAAVVAGLDAAFPGLADYIVDERGSLRKHVNIFIGEEIIHDRENLQDPVQPNDKIFIFQALSGG